LKTTQHKTNVKHENIRVSIHVIYSYILIFIAQKHLTSSTIWCLQNQD